MRADMIKVLKPKFRLIEIDNGTVAPELKIGKTYPIEHAEGSHPLAYYVLKGTRVGAIRKFFEDSQLDGKIRLVMRAEADDPRIAGYPLPIRNAGTLTEFQKRNTVCGHLVGGKFLCGRCTLGKDLVFPDAIPVYPVNIVPYSQNCQNCGLLLFEIRKTSKGLPLMLFG